MISTILLLILTGIIAIALFSAAIYNIIKKDVGDVFNWFVSAIMVGGLFLVILCIKPSYEKVIQPKDIEFIETKYLYIVTFKEAEGIFKKKDYRPFTINDIEIIEKKSIINKVISYDIKLKKK